MTHVTKDYCSAEHPWPPIPNYTPAGYSWDCCEGIAFVTKRFTSRL